MLLRWLPILGFVMAVAACGAPADEPFAITFDPFTPITIVPAADASTDQLRSIDDAVATWNHVGSTRLGLQSEHGARQIPISFERAAANFHGIYRDSLGDIVINTALDDVGERAVVIAHELGHAFGLHHISRSARDSVMNAGNLTVLPNSEDVGLLLDMWGPTNNP